MRCHFCGWDNPQDKENCEKCNKPLAGGSSSENMSSSNPSANGAQHATVRDAAVHTDLKKTVRENSCKPDLNETSREPACPECGYQPYTEGEECASCGYISTKTPSNDLTKTVRPKRKEEKEGTFKLIPISEETGEPEGETISFEGNSTVLNRDNTDPKNKTITSSQQAEVNFENGEWSIEDKSEYQTTFVQASRRIELQSGDLILLGNQLYRFEL